MNIKSIFITIGICLLTFLIGFFSTVAIKEMVVNGKISFQKIPFISALEGDNAIDSVSSRPRPAASAFESKPDTVINTAIDPVKTASIEIEKVDGPYFMVQGRTYSATVHVKDSQTENNNLIYEVYDDNNTLISSTDTDKLVIPQSQSGIFHIVVRNTKTEEYSEPYEVKGCKIHRMSKNRLEQICNSGDYTTMRNTEAYELSPSLKLSFVGVSQEDQVASIDDICTRITLGIWSSVSIVEIRYDNLNLVEFVKFKVNR